MGRAPSSRWEGVFISDLAGGSCEFVRSDGPIRPRTPSNPSSAGGRIEQRAGHMTHPTATHQRRLVLRRPPMSTVTFQFLIAGSTLIGPTIRADGSTLRAAALVNARRSFWRVVSIGFCPHRSWMRSSYLLQRRRVKRKPCLREGKGDQDRDNNRSEEGSRSSIDREPWRPPKRLCHSTGGGEDP